jgi:hypothetical protein
MKIFFSRTRKRTLSASARAHTYDMSQLEKKASHHENKLANTSLGREI